MGKRKLKIGIFGARMGTAHARTFNAMSDLVEITALCEKNTELHSKFDEILAPGGKCYTDFDEFINSGLDAVVLANYFDEHAKYAIKAFEAGVDVLSETTAAPTLKECAELVEACEKYGRKYTLAINCSYFKSVYKMKQLIESGAAGKIYFAEAEYLHATDEELTDSNIEVEKHTSIDLDNLHWRQTLPSCYYNMHTLGPLMHITNAMPLNVYCNAMKDEEHCLRANSLTDCPGGVVITKMDNDAVYQTTGCATYRASSKWYRINCEKGCLETERYDWREERLIFAKAEDMQESTLPGGLESGLDNSQTLKYREKADANHHGGINFYTSYHFVKYLLGEEESEFDVYKAATLSAVGILAWYSALTDKSFRVPDFKNPADRELIRHDSRCPFAKRYQDITLPCKLSEKDKFNLYDPKYKFGL